MKVYSATSPKMPGLVKIGASENPRGRAILIGRDIGGAASIEFETETARPRRVEARAHAMLKDRRRQGEWFEVSPDEARAAIERACAEVAINTETSHSHAVAKSQARNLAAGGERLTLMLTPADAARWRALVVRQGPVRGAKMAAFREALEAAHGAGEPTPRQALAVLARAIGETR